MTTMEDTAAIYDRKIAVLVATSTTGITEEDACRALDENGGDVDAAMSQLSGEKKEQETTKSDGNSSGGADQKKLEYSPAREEECKHDMAAGIIENGKEAERRYSLRIMLVLGGMLSSKISLISVHIQFFLKMKKYLLFHQQIVFHWWQVEMRRRAIR